VRQSNDINTVSQMTGISATRMPESIGCTLAVSISSNAGNVTGPGTSASRWPSCALAILRCWQITFTGLAAETPPPVHTATALTRRQNTWCYSAQLTTRSGGTSGQEESLTRILDASGTSSNRSVRPRMREREEGEREGGGREQTHKTGFRDPSR